MSRNLLSVLLFVVVCAAAGCGRSSDNAKTSESNEQAVLVHLDPAAVPNGKITPSAVRGLEAELESVINRLGLGVFDGDEFAANGSEGTLLMYGPDADRLFEGIEMTLRSSPLCRNARVELRYGTSGSKVRIVRL